MRQSLAPLTLPASTPVDDATPTARRGLPRRARQALLTAHIVLSVGLLGDSAGFLAVAIRAASSGDPLAVQESMRC